ncbi:pyridoxamine 5'-phosphate oxidase family protein [Virgibacillus sp. SK37]|uniref:pyridoxamine 5'-phosphate oxidase family protein n=1 Tax=Virgibacillus sp. SK37 TaxID=403957 RepID=UPI0004D129ED|nr:pyridoxamine 5'-phosphate oxidase family protein [Virgibacillus sp. SK37]AIF42488.1 pyridoxamine 5-phosphate oxidase [Virgibacillus sp. SK37]
MSVHRGEYVLQEKYGTTKRAAAFYNKQMLNQLNDVMKEFISEQAMMFISTADSNGNCDSSFRAGTPGFVRVIDEKTLIYPEYKGNGVMASLGNINENPHIGLMFIDFFENQIGLHVNGKASILENSQLISLEISDEIMDEMIEKEGRKAERWVVIEVDEAYIHCSKHIPRLKKLQKEIEWGTDDIKQKSGDFFKVKQDKRKEE